MLYEEMLNLANEHNLVVKEKDLWVHDGLIKDRNIAIRQTIPTNKEKACTLAEELGHAMTSAGDIMDYNDPNNWKQEVKARTFGYHLMITPEQLIDAYKHGCRGKHELAEYLNVTVPYLDEAVERFHGIYGLYQRYGDYVIVFEPCLNIVEFSQDI